MLVTIKFKDTKDELSFNAKESVTKNIFSVFEDVSNVPKELKEHETNSNIYLSANELEYLQIKDS